MFAKKTLTTCLFTILMAGCGGSDSDSDSPTNAACDTHADCGANQVCSATSALTSAQSALTAEECAAPCADLCEDSGGANCLDVCIDACIAERDPYCDECAAICGADADCNGACEASCVDGPDPQPSPQPSPQGSPEPAAPQGAGVCQPKPGAPSEPEPEAAVDISWAGNWLVSADYTASCAVAVGQPNRGPVSLSVSGTMTGSNSSLSMRFAPDYDMTGSGSNDRLLLSGQFAAKDDSGNAATRSSADNNVTIQLRTITDKDTASGTISGSFKDRFGSVCSILDGTVKFER